MLFHSDHPISQSPAGRNSPLSGHYGHSQLPYNILSEIFFHARETVSLAYPKALWGTPDDATIAVGPPAHLTRVSRCWRDAASSTPLLWSTIPILIESGTLQVLANPGQVQYYLEMAPRTPLKLVIGTREHLLGPSFKCQGPLRHSSLDFLTAIAPRVRDLVVAFQAGSNTLPYLNGTLSNFCNLASLTVLGGEQSRLLVEVENLCQTAGLRKIVWGVSSPNAVSTIPFLVKPWAGLTEVLISDDWGAVLPTDLVHAFLTEAKDLRTFRARIRDSSLDEDSQTREPLPTLQHDNLQTLFITFQALMCDFSDGPPLLSSLRLPHLRRFCFNMHWSANLDPASVATWLGQASHRCLTTFECLVGHIDKEDLLRCLVGLPLLEIFKCTGVLLGSRRHGHSTIDEGKAVIDKEFLRVLATPTAYKVGLGWHISPEELAQAEIVPCPLLREVHVTNAYFTSFQMEAFIRARIYGAGGQNIRLTPLSSLAIDNLVPTRGLNLDVAVFRVRALVAKCRSVYGVDISIRTFLDKGRQTLAGPEIYTSPPLSPID